MLFKGGLTNHKSKRNAECVVGLMRQLTTLYVNVPNLLRERIKKGMIGSEVAFIVKFMEQIESMLNKNGKSINRNLSLRMNLVKPFEILLYRQTIFKTARMPDMIVIDKKHQTPNN